MRVALVCPYAWDAPGGVQVHVGQLARRLRAKGHDVTVLAPAFADPEDPLVRRVGRPVRIRFNRSVAPVSPFPATSRDTAGALRDFRPDVVHVHEPFVPGPSLAAVRAAGAPVVATFHAYADRALLLSMAAPLLRSAWRRLNVRIAVSDAAASFVARRFRDGAIRVIPNGVETELFASAVPAQVPAGRRILFVNRLDPRKGFRVMVNAFAQVADAFPDAILVVAGDGPEREAVGELPGDLRARVLMLGSVAHAELPPYHAAAEVFCAPAVGRESFGIVLVEAMAAGVPVVASDIAGYREVVRDGTDGVLVPPSSPRRTADAIAGVLNDPELAKRLSDAGRRRAERYSWDVVAGEIEAVYHEVARG